jgi:hypothetical protein
MFIKILTKKSKMEVAITQAWLKTGGKTGRLSSMSEFIWGALTKNRFPI